MKLVRDNGLTIVLVLATLATLFGMIVTGVSVYNEELAQHHQPTLSLPAYLTSGHFLSALFENWESEFLQMSAYVTLTAFLFQRGSAESKDPDKGSEQDEDPVAHVGDLSAPLPVRHGGFLALLYAHSLGIALFILFILSFTLHLEESAAAAAVEAVNHGETAPTIWQHASSTKFWFESFQNWQSEFLSTAVLVILSIFLRFRGSPESKAVAAPHSKTGG